MEYTENYGLKKPESSYFYNVDDFNENVDTIDAKLKELETPTYTEATSLQKLVSGEKLSVAFGKIARLVNSAITHFTTKATLNTTGHVKLSDSSAVTDSTGFALPATEKNATIGGTLANQISKVNSDLGEKGKVVQILNSWVESGTGTLASQRINVDDYRYFCFLIIYASMVEAVVTIPKEIFCLFTTDKNGVRLSGVDGTFGAIFYYRDYSIQVFVNHAHLVAQVYGIK